MIGSLFSGIGGLELGLERAGLGPVAWQVEIDPFCRGVLATHWPNARRYHDVRSVGAADLAPVDLICGGFPCQDVSVAGKGAGLAGARSGLWREFARIVGAIRPRLVVVENVASGKRRWLPTVRRDMHVLGYASLAFAVSAFDVGAPHRRERVFVVAAADGDGDKLRDAEQRVTGRRARGVRDEGEGEPGNDGATGAASDANGEGQPRGAAGDGPVWNWTRDGGSWHIEPPVCGVAHGVPRRMDRLRALGNAVVPQCAEAVGRMIAEVLT